MKKLIIFDLDGTLSDTKGIVREIIYDTLTDLGIHVDSVQTIWDSIEQNGGEVFGNRSFVPNDYKDMIDRENYDILYWKNYDRHFMTACDRIYDGIYETLDELKKRGHALAVLSNKNDRHVQPIIAKSFPDTFDFILGALENIPHKPDPAGLLMICEKLGFDSAEAYMIGDLAFDCKAAVNANAHFIGALWGYGGREKLTASGATLFAEKPTDILGII